MSLKTLYHPVTGKSVKMGRTPPKLSHARLEFKNYASAALPAPPDPVDYANKAHWFLSEVLHNDTLGDCTCAGIIHIIGNWEANAGNPINVGPSNALWLYEHACGYVPGDPSTDQGGNEQDVLAFVRANGAGPGGGHKIAGFVAVDATNPNEVMQALWLFENVYLGMALPDAWVNPFPSGNGFVWDVAGDPDPDNGHCVVGLGGSTRARLVGYNSVGVIIDTWGMLGTITWAALAKYCVSGAGGELWTMVGADIIAKANQKAPNGFAFAQLTADLPSL